jgi:hypothetical protein
MKYVWGRTVFWLGDLREREHLEDPDVDGRITLKKSSRSWMGNTPKTRSTENTYPNHPTVNDDGVCIWLL